MLMVSVKLGILLLLQVFAHFETIPNATLMSVFAVAEKVDQIYRYEKPGERLSTGFREPI